jgi:TonB family protein
MPDTILVVEYEPRYIERVRQAFAGQTLQPSFAKDGDEAQRALDAQQHRLIVLSSIIPKTTTVEMIRMIRAHRGFESTPILLTVSGYSGRTPRADASRVGASDLLPKPYSEGELLAKVFEMLGMPRPAAPPVVAVGPLPGVGSDFKLHRSGPPLDSAGQLTSNEIFGDLLGEEIGTGSPAGATRPMKPTDDVDKMLAELRQTGKNPTVPKTTGSGTTPTPGSTRAKVSADLDKLLSDTLSGLEKTGRMPKPTTSPGVGAAAVRPAAPAPAAPAAAPTPAPTPAPTARTAVPDRVPIAAPVFPPASAAPKEEEPEPTDGTRFGQYVLVEKIATGGMAEVWKARMRGVEGFQKIVAIKKILPHLSDNQEFVDMFIDEAKFAAQLNHNNIIHIYDLGKIVNSYYIAMEYVEGHDLKSILRQGVERDQPLAPEIALFIASKIASALDYAHRKRDFDEKEMGLVHRDVSPQNVLVSYDGDIKLCDFGIAKAVSKASHTQSGALKGKLQYMSPEQAWGTRVDRRSDIFALGAVLYEMLTGRKLFTGDNEMSILEQVREATIVKPSEINDEISPEIEGIVLKALRKDPESRYQTAGEMARDLDAILYTFRPTPTSADLAIHMHRLYAEQAVPTTPTAIPAFHTEDRTDIGELSMMRRPRSTPVAAPPGAVAVAPASMQAPEARPAAVDEEPARKSSALIPIAAAIVLLLGGAAYFFMRGGSKPAPVTAGPSPAGKPVTSTAGVASTSSAVTTSPTATTTLAAATPAAVDTAATASQPMALDQSKIDEEVRKRLAAERARLEQQQLRAQQTVAVVPPPAPRPNVVATTQTTATPPPVIPASAPTQTQPPVTESRAAEPVAAAAPPPAPARVKEGDLVPVGTEGLEAPKLLRRAQVNYPPLARVQRVEGMVILSVLVSETGKVLDVKVLRGVSKAVGLNEAATEAARRSTFAPATKDGVHVKSYVTVPVDFKL